MAPVRGGGVRQGRAGLDAAGDTPDKPLPFFAKSQSNRKAYLWFAWLRSPNASNTNYFCCVYTSGAANNYIASGSRGVAPGFRVGIKAKTAEPAQD